MPNLHFVNKKTAHFLSIVHPTFSGKGKKSEASPEPFFAGKLSNFIFLSPRSTESLLLLESL